MGRPAAIFAQSKLRKPQLSPHAHLQLSPRAHLQPGRPTRFYQAVKLLKEYRVHDWPGWGHMDKGGLYPRKFTHEFLSHGTIKYRGDRLRHVRLEEFILNDLFEIYPEFEVLSGMIAIGLYERLCALRWRLFYSEDQSS